LFVTLEPKKLGDMQNQDLGKKSVQAEVAWANACINAKTGISATRNSRISIALNVETDLIAKVCY